MYDMSDDENRGEGRGEEEDKQVEYKKSTRIGLTTSGHAEQVVCWSHDWWAHRTSRLLVSRPVDTPNKSSAGLTTGGRYQDTDEQAG